MVMTTSKSRVGCYIPHSLKEDAERLAKSQRRTLSNLVEVLLAEAVEQYKQSEGGNQSDSKSLET